MRQSPEDRRPEHRNLRIFAIDPMVSRGGDHQVTVQIRYEPLAPSTGDPSEVATDGKPYAALSFRGRRVEVVDVDTASQPPVWLRPVNLDDAHVAMQHGLEPSESDPQFHQQMVYAVAMRTLEQFDRALGRVVYLRGRRRLRLVPHAFHGSNAFYHPRPLHAVLFGYFRASEESPGENLPGQTIFTCLSHDIIAHEVTHAIVDRLRPFFHVATNPHVRAFHEAFADIVAIFQRLSYRELVQRALQDARGDVRQTKLLSDIAAQFGEGLGGGALRTALDSTTKIQDEHEEHALGAVLVAAVFEAFYKTYERRSADLVRIATGGTGELPKGALHPDLVERLTSECVRTAQSVLTMCIRAFDYLPPADVTFGAFLRALVTADWELNPLDPYGLRAAVIEACRRRGIFAVEAGSLAVSALLLDSPPPEQWGNHEATFRNWVDQVVLIGVAEQRAETPEDEPDTPAHAATTSISSVIMQQAPPVLSDPTTEPSSDDLEPERTLRSAIESWFGSLSGPEREQLGMRAESVLASIRFHASQRVASDGTLPFSLVVQLVEVQTLSVEGADYEFPSGVTLVIDVTGRVRFVIRSTRPETRMPELVDTARRSATSALGWELASAANPFAVDYRNMHEGRTWQNA